MRTTSPAFAWFCSSCAWNFFERRITFLYFGCAFTESTRTTIVLSIAAETTTPRRCWSRPRSPSGLGSRVIGLRCAGFSRAGFECLCRWERGRRLLFFFGPRCGAVGCSAAASSVAGSASAAVPATGSSSACSAATGSSAGTSSATGSAAAGSSATGSSGAGSSAGASSATGSGAASGSASSTTASASAGSAGVSSAFLRARFGFASAASGAAASGSTFLRVRFGFSSTGVSSAVSSVFSVFFSSATRYFLALVADGQDAGDLALRQSESRRVLERTRRRLEAQVEQLLARLIQVTRELSVGHVAQLPCSHASTSSSQRRPLLLRVGGLADTARIASLAVLLKEISLPLDHLGLHGQLGPGQAQRLFRQRLRDARELEHDAARLDHRHPVLRRTLPRA